jgi:phosphatidylinositol glycan class A protein
LIHAFCVLIVKAAACELCIISTDIGGISELLPEEARTLCHPLAFILAQEGLNAIRTKRNFHEAKAQRVHTVLSQRLSWKSAASQLFLRYSSKWSAHSVCFECTRHNCPFITTLCLVYFAVLSLFVAIFADLTRSPRSARPGPNPPPRRSPVRVRVCEQPSPDQLPIFSVNCTPEESGDETARM